MSRRGERGETLVEILVSTTLLGIIGVGIIGAIASVLISTDIDRKSSAAETVIRSYAAAVQRAAYQPCPGADYSSVAVGFDPPPNYAATVVRVTAWDGVGPVVVPATAPPPSQSGALNLDGDCTAANEHGLQRIDLRVDALAGGAPDPRGRTTLTTVKRDPDLSPTTTPSAP